MSGWFIFFLAYVVFLVVGFSLAFLYRRHLEVKERKFFEELLKIRAHIYTQINALIQTYSELLRISKKKEKSYLADKDSLDLGEAAILARDVQSNLAIIKSELNDLRVFENLALAKEGMLKIIAGLNEHILALLPAENLEKLAEVLENKAFEKGKKDLKKVNTILEKFMKDKGIKESSFSALDWLTAPRER